LQSARRARDAARYDARDTKRLLAYETAESFLTVLAADRVARAAAQRLELAQRNREEVQVRFGAQLVSSNDVTLAELEAASAERELVRVRGLARTARLNLGQLLAVEVAEDDSLTVPRDLLVAAAQPVAEFPVPKSQAVERRPDVQAGRARAAAAHSIAREPLMRYFPDLDFLGSAWSTNESGLSGEDTDWTVGLGLTWELFDGFERESDRSERAALARAAELDLAHLERRVEVDVETAQVAVESQQASLARAEVAVDAAQRNANETSELYRRGLLRAFEVVDANRTRSTRLGADRRGAAMTPCRRLAFVLLGFAAFAQALAIAGCGRNSGNPAGAAPALRRRWRWWRPGRWPGRVPGRSGAGREPAGRVLGERRGLGRGLRGGAGHGARSGRDREDQLPRGSAGTRRRDPGRDRARALSTRGG
jgi:hypothetical protein